MFTFKPTIHYVPFPIGLAENVLADEDYRELARTYPSSDEFVHKNRSKDLRSTFNNRTRKKEFASWINRHSAWKRFHDEVTSNRFAEQVFAVLASHGIRFTEKLQRPPLMTELRKAAGDILKRRQFPVFSRPVRSRVEFGAYPADGGYIKPHTDAPGTLVTLVMPMCEEGEWSQDWGGELEICKPKKTEDIFNFVNAFGEFDDFTPVTKFAFQPNQAMFFVKTYDSWHCVRPMTAPAGEDKWRKTVVVVFEVD